MVPDRGIRSRWGVIVALVGYIVLVGYAVFAQPEYRSPITQPGHAVQAKADRKSEDNQPPPYPVTTLKAFRAAEDAGAADCGASKDCRTDQRDYSDLQAQWEAAKGAQGQLQFARWQTWIAGLGTALVAIALYYTAKATMAALEANKIGHKTYLADQRPWVAVDLKIAGPFQWKTDVCLLELEITIQNTGRSPALNVCRHLVMLGHPCARDMERDQAALADRMLSAIGGKIGMTLFPGQERKLSYTVAIDRDEMAFTLKWQTERNWSAVGDLHPTVIGCVLYYSTLDKAPHHTPIICDLRRTQDGGPPRQINRGAGDIPAGELELRWGAKSGRVD